MKEIRALTSLRGIAAIWVFLFHLDLERPAIPAPLRDWLAIGHGYIGVDLFFALSGFVMALTYRETFLSKRFKTAYASFLLRRVARVLPLNVAVVCAILASVWLDPAGVGSAFPSALNTRTAIANLLLVQDWGFAPSMDKPAWSVSIEMAVYLTFPMLVALAWSRRLWAVAALIGAAALYWLARSGGGQVSQGLLIGDITRGFVGFTFGLLCFRAFISSATPRLIGRFDLAIVAAFWAAALFSPTDLWAILLCPAIILSLAFGNGPLAHLLGFAPLHYLGRISYSVYLVHYCVLRGLDLLSIRSAEIYGIGAFALTIALSAATYRWIERPARRWLAEFPFPRPR